MRQKRDSELQIVRYNKSELRAVDEWDFIKLGKALGRTVMAQQLEIDRYATKAAETRKAISQIEIKISSASDDARPNLEVELSNLQSWLAVYRQMVRFLTCCAGGTPSASAALDHDAA